MFGEILERFIKGSPVAVMVRALLENLLNADKLDRWFEGVRQTQYTKEILFSSIVGLMLQVVCKIRPSVHCAYPHSGIAASVVEGTVENPTDRRNGQTLGSPPAKPGVYLIVGSREIMLTLEAVVCWNRGSSCAI